MGITSLKDDDILVTFHHKELLFEQRLRQAELTALFNSDLISTPLFKQGLKIEKKVWVRDEEKGIYLEIHLN